MFSNVLRKSKPAALKTGGRALYDDRRFSQLAKRAWSSGSIATNFTPIPFWASLHCTMARARIWPTGASSKSWIKVPAGGGSVVRIQSPPKERLDTRETCRVLPLRHARSVPLGEEIRGWRRVSFVVATETPKASVLFFGVRARIFWRYSGQRL